MDLDDILDDERDETNSEMFDKTIIFMEQLELEQPLVKGNNLNNAYSINKKLINSQKYHYKFEQLPVNELVAQKLYLQAGRLLDKVDGQEKEWMLAVDRREGDLIVDNFNRDGNIKGTGFTPEEYDKILECQDQVIIMHNHSLNGRPSAQDLIAYSKDEHVILSLIVCHDGTLYAIYDANPEIESIYNDLFDEYKNITNDEEEAKHLATTALYKANNKENVKRKLFVLRRF